MQPLRIGLFGIGLDTYWPQFPGLRARLLGHLRQVHRRLARPGVRVVDLGLVDTPEKGLAAGHAFRRADVDLVFLFATTYALSSTVLPVVQRAKVPVVVLDLSPAAAIDYAAFRRLPDRTAMTGEWLAHCHACPVPEIANVFRRAGIAFHEVTGRLHDDEEAWREIDGWIAAAEVAHTMAHNRLGLMGHYYGGMLDIYADLTQHCAQFGGHMEIVEVEELAARRRAVKATQVRARVAELRRVFDVQADCRKQDLEQAARTSVALDALVQAHDLGSLAYYHQGTGSAEHEAAIASIILGNSLLTARGIPVAGEYEVKNVQAMKILDTLGCGGSFTEYYALDWDDDVVLMGHDGPGHIAISEGRTKVRPLGVYHGKVGSGLSVEMSVRHGPVTLLAVAEDGHGRLQFVVAEGESVPGPVLPIGNTNSRYRFGCGARAFVRQWNAAGPAHHCAVGIGHHAATIDKLGRLLGTTTTKVS